VNAFVSATEYITCTKAMFTGSSAVATLHVGLAGVTRRIKASSTAPENGSGVLMEIRFFIVKLLLMLKAANRRQQNGLTISKLGAVLEPFPQHQRLSNPSHC